MILSPWRGQKRTPSRRKLMLEGVGKLLDDYCLAQRKLSRRQTAIYLCHQLAKRHKFQLIVSTPDYRE